MSTINRLVVANRYRLQRVNGKYVQEGRVLQRENMKVLTDYVEQVNEQSALNGYYFEIDEQATVQLKEKQAENRELRKAQSAVNDTKAVDLLKAIGTLAGQPQQQEAQPAKKEKEPKSIEAPESVDENSTRDEIIAYLKANGIKFNPANATEKLLIIALEGGKNG